ncbi:hypothetical protein CFOL_v3_36023, partial [Cephalotus follicularis]
IIKPFKVTNEGITTKLFQQKLLFAFNEKPITKEINLLKTFSLFKEHFVNLIKTKENHFYFMKQEAKRHMVFLPYEKNFTEQNIPTKTRPIQMTYELMGHFKKEIQELLNKKLIEPSKSLWSCTTFCVQKTVINYKTLKIKFYTHFRRHEWTVILLSSQNASRRIQKIMNDFFNPFSSFPIEYVNNNSIVPTNKLALPRTNLYLFILQNHYIPIQRSALFSKKSPNVIVNKK